ncbi:MAG: methylmalonyl-CoA mutase, partial [Anaerolineales bacterium]|nr:methylmalonyl-CoA mutase [Anaerolineales bacterium]
MSKPIDDYTKSWETNTLAPALQRRSERKPHFETPSGINIERVYLPTDSDPDYPDKLGFPGEYPYTRGVQATMYRGQLWT